MIIIGEKKIERLGKKVAKKLKAKYSRLEVEKFPDKEFKITQYIS